MLWVEYLRQKEYSLFFLASQGAGKNFCLNKNILLNVLNREVKEVPIMFKTTNENKPFENKVWLASPCMHGEEMTYVKDAYDTNWMSTVGANINEVEKIAAEKAGVKYAVALSCCTAALHLCVKLAGERLYGKPAISHGAVEK